MNWFKRQKTKKKKPTTVTANPEKTLIMIKKKKPLYSSMICSTDQLVQNAKHIFYY